MSTSAVQPPLAPPPQQESVVHAVMKEFGRRIQLCSLHYMPVRESRDYMTSPNGGWNAKYNLDAVRTKGKHPSMLVVLDGFQRVFRGTNDYYEKTFSREPELAIHIAKDIVRAATGMEPGGPEMEGPAVWISHADKFPQTESDWSGWGKPEFAQRFPQFAAECDAFAQRQYRFCERKVRDGDQHHTLGMAREINEIHRRAAEYMEANLAEHPWIKLTTFGEKIQCPYCGAAASSSHPLCSNCQKIINPALYQQIEAQMKTPQDVKK